MAARNGPVLDRTCGMIEGVDGASAEWGRYFRNADPWEVELVADPGIGELSRQEIEKLQRVACRFEPRDDWEVADHTHTLPEWQRNRPEGETRREIPLDDLLQAVGLGEYKTDLESEAEALAAFDRLLASASPK